MKVLRTLQEEPLVQPSRPAGFQGQLTSQTYRWYLPRIQSARRLCATGECRLCCRAHQAAFRLTGIVAFTLRQYLFTNAWIFDGLSRTKIEVKIKELHKIQSFFDILFMCRDYSYKIIATQLDK